MKNKDWIPAGVYLRENGGGNSREKIRAGFPPSRE